MLPRTKPDSGRVEDTRHCLTRFPNISLSVSKCGKRRSLVRSESHTDFFLELLSLTSTDELESIQVEARETLQYCDNDFY